MGFALGFWAIPAVVALAAWTPQLSIGRPANRDAPSQPGVALAPMWKKPLAWQVMLYMGIGSLLLTGPLSWLPQIYQSRGVDAATAGYLLLVMNFLGMVGACSPPRRRKDARPASAGGGGRDRDPGRVPRASSGAERSGLRLDHGAGDRPGSQFGLAVLFLVLRSANGSVAARLSSMAQCGAYLIAAAGPFVMGFLHTATRGWVVPILF